VWRRIEAELRPEPEVSEPWWQNLFLWRGATVAATALALVLALQPPPTPVTLTPEGGVVMVLTDEESKTAWLVSRQSAEAPLMAQPVQLPVLTLQQAYELWLSPPDTAPRRWPAAMKDWHPSSDGPTRSTRR
jgi:anti-sigma-K factor RskA